MNELQPEPQQVTIEHTVTVPPITIEKGIPIPSLPKPPGEAPADAEHVDRTAILLGMENGDSFMVTEAREQRSWASTMTTLKRSGRAVFTSRAVPGGWRIWRIG